MKNQVFNPFLPSWEYIPDGEPHVFGDRVYLFGSHDRFDGDGFCLNNYVGWSAPVTDLSDWAFHGEIFDVRKDPSNTDGKYQGYAPDVCKGNDGRYYMYYALNNDGAVSVAVCDEPCGKYEFLGCVRTKDGRVYGLEKGDVFCFDPAVFVDEDGSVHLYIGFSHTAEMVGGEPWETPQKTNGAYHFELCPDMLTLKGEGTLVCPGMRYAKGTSFEGHGFFEASSMRKFGGIYYFIYSSEKYHELCYGTGDSPKGPFTYGGVLVSATNVGINGNKEHKNFPANNHGSIEKIGEDFYIFYHRHTNRTMYSRQACAEKIEMTKDGRFLQAECTSFGLGASPFEALGVYEARIACELSSAGGSSDYGWESISKAPFFTQTGSDREEKADQYISYMGDGSFAVFRYFEIEENVRVRIKVRGDGNGIFIISHEKGGVPCASVRVTECDEFKEFTSEDTLQTGIFPFYFTYKGEGHFDFASFELYR